MINISIDIICIFLNVVSYGNFPIRITKLIKETNKNNNHCIIGKFIKKIQIVIDKKILLFNIKQYL